MSEAMQYKCPCCGGEIVFDSTSQKMKCPYCDNTFDVETVREYGDEINRAPEDRMEWEQHENAGWSEAEQENIVFYTCSSCGGEIIGDKSTAATSCPYCGNPVVMKDQFQGDLRPDWVIPFKLDKNAAKAALSQYLKGKRLLPKLFKDRNRIEEIKGIYVPFWLFDCDTEANIRYRATRTRNWSDSNNNYVETSHFLLVREGGVGFECVPVDGSSKMPDTLMEAIEPYHFNEAVDFETAYLSGFFAERYDVGSDDSVDRVNERIRNSTAELFRDTTGGYVTCVPQDTRIRFSNGKIRYALLPVWLLNTKYNGKTYTFAMNGQTGKFIGDLPVDKGAFWKWFFGITAGVGAAVMLLLCLLL
ncbi:MAG: hypothetical protein ACLSVG_00110 [Clostridia bacterium]